MIPLIMTVKNFLSYGNTPVTIDFRPYRLIALSGKNGHGKSALLDAVTWAVWGHARKCGGAPRAESGLLRLGQKQMMVCLDFYAQDTHFRINRQYTLDTSRGYMTLDFGIVNLDETVAPLTAKTIRATQHKINTLIGLSYETFVNSAFLKQGQSHEFSKKSPRERKEVLCQILGLAKFEQMKKMASLKSKENSIAAQYLQQSSKKLREAVAHKETILAEAAALKIKLQKIDVDRTLCEKQIVQLNEAQHLQQKKIAERHHLQETEQHLSKNIRHKTADAIELCQKMRKILRIKSEDVTLLEEKIALQEKSRCELQQAQVKKISHQQQLLKRQQQKHILIEQHAAQYIQHKQKKLIAREKTSTELKANQLRKTELEKTMSHIEARQQHIHAVLTELEKSIQKEKDLKEALTYDTKKNAKQQAALMRWRTTIERLKKEQHVLTETSMHTHLNACPLCEQPLDTVQQHKIQARFTLRDARISRAMNRYKQALPPLQGAFELLQKRMSHTKQAIDRVREQHHQQVQLTQQHEQLKEDYAAHQETYALSAREERQLADTLEAHNRAYQELIAEEQRTQTTLPKYGELTKEIDALSRALASQKYAIDFDSQEKRIRETIRELKLTLQQAHRLEQQRVLYAEYKTRLHTFTDQVKKYKTEKNRCLETIAQIDTTLSSSTVTNALATAKQKMEDILSQKEELLEKKGSLDAAIAQLHAQDKELITLQEQEKHHLDAMHEWNIVSSAVSKNGIQALLIDQVLPEIEEEANQLLSRLTNNRAHIAIESLKDTKHGSVKETLDINISDQLGTRAYELFSGGEAFRIDFALRIALSKLLARRASATLSTLIIDEGFGSQDEEGLQHMLACIHAIQNDFEKIIIVSHLQTLKDEFPVNFSIVKTASGSSVSIMETGVIACPTTY